MAIEMRVLGPDIAKNVFQVHSSQFTSLPHFYLLSHQLKVSLHSISHREQRKAGLSFLTPKTGRIVCMSRLFATLLK